MDPINLLFFIIIGGIAGWLAGMIVKGSGQGILMNVIVGIVGAFLGGWLLGGQLAIFGSPLVNSLVIATIGAIILLVILNLIKKTR